MDTRKCNGENADMDGKCIIYVFSGTGNTLAVAKEYRAALSIETEIFEIDETSESFPSPDGYDFIGIGYPVHAFNAPPAVRRFCRKLRTNTSRPLFIFHTGGEGLPFNDSSSFAIRGILCRNGFRILSEQHYVMPYNMIFRHSDEMVKHMVTYMRRIVPLHVSKIENGITEKMEMMPVRHIISVILRIEWIYARAQGKAMKANNSCISCGLCARSCPMGNIKMVNGKPQFGTNCTLCVRCSFSCPVNAISIGLLNGWKVNGGYEIEKIMNDDSIPAEIPLEKLSLPYRCYYKKYQNKTY